METVLPYLAISMGFMSSFHCIGMCGPIALAIPVRSGSVSGRYFNYVLYNLGRTSTYTLLGLIAGSMAATISLVGYLKYFSVAAGIILIIYAVGPAAWNRYYQPPALWRNMIRKVKTAMSSVLLSHHTGARYLLGMLNGLLPCGMVTMALVSSMATGKAWSGGVFMFLFGLGTLPAMLGISMFKEKISPEIRSRLFQMTPVIMLMIGLWLVIRGFMLDFPAGSSAIPVCTGN